ncbi:Uncharacterised protein [Raoultella planticola]|uniref:Uncharacterized protein n=1 Tax=Raoultella planticola TaxID=575 RepID=A0A485ABR6_RAOPL|nr:Uncharacterised protein [Raoultella planticola]
MKHHRDAITVGKVKFTYSVNSPRLANALG